MASATCPSTVSQPQAHSRIANRLPGHASPSLGWAPEPVSKLGSDPITLLAAQQASKRRQQSGPATQHPVHGTFSHGPSSPPRLPASPTRRRTSGANNGLNSTFSSLPNIAPDAIAPLQTSRTSCLSLGDMRQELQTVLSVPRRQAVNVFTHAARVASLRSHPGPHRGEPKVLIRGRPVDPVVAEGIRARAQAVKETQAAGYAAHVARQEQQEVSAVQHAVREDLRNHRRQEGRSPSPSQMRPSHPPIPHTPLQSPSKGVRGSPRLHHNPGTFFHSPPHAQTSSTAAGGQARSSTRPPPESVFPAALAPTATHIPPIAQQSLPQTGAEPPSPPSTSHHGLRTAGREAATMTLEEQETLNHNHPRAPSRQEPSLSIPSPTQASALRPLIGLTCAPPPVYTYPIKMTVSELGIPVGRITRDLHKLSQYDPIPDPPRPTCSPDTAAAVNRPPLAATAGDGSARSLPTRSQTEPALAKPAGAAGPIQRTPSKSILRPSKPSLHDINMQGDYRWRAQALTAKTAPAAAVKRVKSAKSVRFLVVQGHHTDPSAC